MRTLRSLGLLLTVAILFISCFKSENPYPSGCKVVKATYYNGNAIADSSVYTYSGDKVIGLKTDGANYRFLYDTLNLIVRRDFYTVDSVKADKYDTITYNANKTLKRIDTYTNLGSGAYLLSNRIDFVYTASGKLFTITTYNMSTGAALKEHNYRYIFDYNNIIAVNHTDFTGTTPTSEVFTYSHDNTSNYFTRQNNQVFLIDPFFNDFDPTLLPFTWNANNITNISNGNNSTMVVLDLDAYHKNLMDVKIKGLLGVHYEYQCQN